MADLEYPRFIGEPLMRFHPTKKNFLITTEPFTLWLNDKDFCEVPPGSLINGASIPWLLQILFSVYDPRYNLAAAFHDPACGEQQEKILAFIGGEHRQLTWRESAQWFKAGIRCLCKEKWLRVTFYQAVMLKKRPKKLHNNIRKSLQQLACNLA